MGHLRLCLYGPRVNTFTLSSSKLSASVMKVIFIKIEAAFFYARVYIKDHSLLLYVSLLSVSGPRQ